MSPVSYLLDGKTLALEPLNSCLIGIQAIENSPPGFELNDVYILGDVFIRSFYTSLDFETEVISLT